MNTIAKNSFLVIASKVISLVLGILSSVFFIRLIGATGKGNLTLLETSAALIVLVTSFNLNFGIIHFVSKKQEQSKILGMAIYMVLFCLFITITIILLSKYLNFYKYIIPEGDFFEFSLLLFSMVFILTTKEVFSSFLKGLKLFKDLYTTTIVYSVFRVALFAFLYFLQQIYDFDFSTISLLWAHVFCLSIVLFITFYYFIKKIDYAPSFIISKIQWKSFLTYCGIGLIVLLINFFSRRADVWIIDFSLDKESLGYYAVAIGLCDFILQIPMTLRNVLFPYLSSTDSATERVKLLSIFSRINFSIIIFIALFLFAVSDFLLPLMFGNDFIPSIIPFKILVFAIAFIGFRSFLMSYFMSVEKQKINIIGVLIGLVTLLIFDYILVPKYGIVGASYGALLSYFISTVFIYLIFQKKENTERHQMFFINKNDFIRIKSIIRSKL